MVLPKNNHDRLSPHPLTLLVFLLAFIFFYFKSFALMRDPDMPWHIAAGTMILQQHSIPLTDSWSFTADGAPWYNISWLWDCVLSLVSHTGLSSIFVLSALLHGALLALLFSYMTSRRDIKETGAAAAVFIAALLLGLSASARPQIITLLFTLMFVRTLHTSRALPEWKRLMALPALMLPWVNIHGGFVTGFIILGAYGLEALITRDLLWFKRLFITGLICLAVTLINPLGWNIILAVQSSLNSAVGSYIMEWHPMSFGTIMEMTLVVAVFILVSNSRDPEIPWADKILAFSWLFAAMLSMRHFAIFAIVAAPYLAINLSKIGTPKPLPDVSSPLARLIIRVCTTTTVLAIVLIPSLRQTISGQDTVMDEQWVPINAIEYIKANYPNTRFYNNYTYGGYMIYYAPNTPKVFVDSRADTAYSKEVLDDVITLFDMKEGWKNTLDRYQIEGLFVRPTDKLASAYELGALQGWEQVYKDDLAVILIRQPSETSMPAQLPETWMD